jgi:hypothetical protein
MSISNVGDNPYASHKGYIPTVTVNGRIYGASKTSTHDESSNKPNVQATQSASSPKAPKKSSNPYANHTGYIPYATVNGRTYGLGKPTSTLNTHI